MSVNGSCWMAELNDFYGSVGEVLVGKWGVKGFLKRISCLLSDYDEGLGFNTLQELVLNFYKVKDEFL